MQQVIFIKFDELYLKGNNINSFKDRLVTNLKNGLYNFTYDLKLKYDAIELSNFANDKTSLLLTILSKIPGFSKIMLAYKIEHDLNELYKICNDLVLKYPTFKIEVKRANKKYAYNSDQLKRMIASYILNNNKNIKVDIHHYATKVNVEVRQNHFYIFNQTINGTKGLPIGSSGKALMLLSGGIDSPVASHLLMCRGMHVDFLIFITPPFTKNELIDKIKKLVKTITLNYRLESPKIYLCNYTNIQNELVHLDKESYRITLLRRSFVRIANNICDKLKYDCLATGDSLGQVASQTIESLNVINEASNKVILRPLITYNKEKIIEYAKEIKTYAISILPLSDTCSLFAPKNPVTKPKLEITKKLEEKLTLLKSLEDNVINNIEVIKYDKK